MFFSSEGVVKLLDVGAIVERYPKNDPRVQGIQIVPTSIDLYSQDKNVQQIDFFDFCKQNKTTFDAAVLSLVLNYVASPLERGKMLLQAARMVRRGGYLFLGEYIRYPFFLSPPLKKFFSSPKVLPVSCISNSRYLKFSLLKRLLSRVGFNIPDDNGYKTTDKFFSCVAIRGDELVGAAGFETEAMFVERKKAVFFSYIAQKVQAKTLQRRKGSQQFLHFASNWQACASSNCCCSETEGKKQKIHFL